SIAREPAAPCLVPASLGRLAGTVPNEVFELVPKEAAFSWRVCPLGIGDDGALEVAATSDSPNLVDALSFQFSRTVPLPLVGPVRVAVVAPAEEVETALLRHYGSPPSDDVGMKMGELCCSPVADVQTIVEEERRERRHTAVALRERGDLEAALPILDELIRTN